MHITDKTLLNKRNQENMKETRNKINVA